MAFTLRRKTYKHRCPDGSIKLVHRNIDDAFPLALKDLGLKLEADVAALGGEGIGKSQADLQSHIKGLLFRLNELNQSLMMSFRAVYAAYQTDPCRNGDAYMRQVERIVEEVNRQTLLQVKISGLISLSEQNGTDGSEVMRQFRAIVVEVGGQSVQAAAAEEVQSSRADAHIWLEPPTAEDKG